jgi:hypothetical protein
MEDMELINLWKSYGKTLEESLSLNRKNAEDITRMKVKSLLSSMRPVKVFAVVVGTHSGAIPGGAVKGVYSFATLSFDRCRRGQHSLFAVVVHANPLILIQQVEIDEPILLTQERRNEVVHHMGSTDFTLTITALDDVLLEQIHASKRKHGPVHCSGAGYGRLPAGLWLFRNISFANREKWSKPFSMVGMDAADEIDEMLEPVVTIRNFTVFMQSPAKERPLREILYLFTKINHVWVPFCLLL